MIFSKSNKLIIKVLRFSLRIVNRISGYLKNRLDSITNNKYKENLLNAIPFWLGSFVVGIIAVIYAKLFQVAEWCSALLFNFNKWLFLGIAPLCFAVGWWLVKEYAPYARGSGIPQVSASIELANPKKYHLIDRFLSIRVIIVKIASSLVLVFGGGVIGREGPTIQISGAVFKKINDWLPEWYPKISKKNMIITGAASGLAAAFNTPLGGIVFAIEELTKTHFNFFKSALFTGVIISGLTALSILGPYLYLGYPHVNDVSFWIIFPVLLVAIITGYASSQMGNIILYIFRKKSALKTNGGWVAYCIVAGLIIAALGIFISKDVFGSGKEIMQETLFTQNKVLPWYTPVLRFVGPIISFTNGASGGIFAPSLSAGASIGSVLAGWFQFNDEGTNLLILAGMVGFLTGITRSPFTSSILVQEMTTADRMIFYLMMSALAASLAASLVNKHSFYDHLKLQYLSETHHA